MRNSERNFILYLIQEEGLNVNSAEFDEAVNQYGIGDEDAMYYYEFRQFIGE